uniref:Sulfate_transp domain-containing protein n=1 Tax=Rhabditophanes sp. KR3021 TaxID=114890 RepID=A0AC35TG10_9BILA
MDDTNSIAALRKVEKTADSSRIYKITRNALTQEEFDDAFSQSNGNDQTTLTQQIKAKVKKSLSQKWFTRNLLEEWIPIVRWMREYDIKTSLVSDISAGITVGTMNIPQSMAYAELAMLDPVIGLYTSMAALIYAFFGTSKHVSLGTFAVVSLLVADAQTNYYDSHPNSTLSHGELVSSLTFTVGLILLIFACLQLHVLMAYLSDALISGFTVGCVCHVFISVLPKMFGVSIISPGGLLTLFKSTIDFFEKLPDTNFADLIISVIAVVFLYVGKEMINPWLRRTNKLPVPIPFELILVFFNTLFSYLFNFRQFGVSVVGIIPTGFPTPRMIRFETIPDLLVAGDAISIAVVIYVITFSVAKLFAKKHNYKANAKQDLRALVICELIVSFLDVFLAVDL